MSSAKRWTALVSACVALLGCNNTTSEPTESRKEPLTTATATPPPMATPTPTRPAPERKMHRARSAGADAFFAAASELELSDEQRAAIGKARDALRDTVRPESSRGAMESLQSEIVAGVKAGKIDNAKLEPHYAELEKAQKERHQAEAKALNELHAKLEPAQRKKVVETLRADQTKRAEKMAAAKGRHPVEEGARGAPSKVLDKPDYAKRRLEQLSRDLELDEAQQKKVEALLAKKKPEDKQALMEKNQKRMSALIDAFEKDKLDATGLELPGKTSIREHSKLMLEEVNGLLGIVKPEQRDKLAEHVARGHKKMGRPMRGTPGMPGMGMQPRRLEGSPPEDTGDELDVPSEE